ncbi:hypothetical protein [Corynebacterium diphtheriae]|uniref:hypothetical protein n=1 Tax=Corynebacterium diphtheriae TaxID=1717 RepID=UPI0012FFA34F|nr:hypothetical protein [Corynebacterium diphtheriae]
MYGAVVVAGDHQRGASVGMLRTRKLAQVAEINVVKALTTFASGTRSCRICEVVISLLSSCFFCGGGPRVRHLLCHLLELKTSKTHGRQNPTAPLFLGFLCS